MNATSARLWAPLLIAWASGMSGPADGQPLADPGQKRVRVVRTTTPPMIDGVLDDTVWADAAYIDDLHQVNPVEYAPPSAPTEIWILYDDDALYVAAKLHTPPGLLTANMMRQGGSIVDDDSLFVTLDPFNTRRSGYFFGINPHGVRYDGLYRNVSEYYSDWDGIFHAATGSFDGGWTVEYEIPFKTLSFDPNTDTWGLNFSRTLAQRNEDMAWVTRNRRWDPSTAGLAVGFEGLRQGVGLDVVPSVSVTNARSFGPGPGSDADLEPSLDVAYKLTPALNALLTINTDFSATEVDDRQVNLTRFSLFFPEKRDFFLREADIFEFGRIGAQDGNGAVSGAERQNGRPFFSRRIGLSDTGQIVDLDYGGKISGRVGRFEIGALSIRQDEAGGIGADNLSVIRAKAGIGAESTVGVIVTEGTPTSNDENSLAGVDFLYRNSRLPGGRTIEAGAWLQQSETNGVSEDSRAAGIGFSIPSNAGFRGGLALREIEAGFDPALGFLSRSGVRDYSGHIAYTHRPAGGYWQSLYFGIDGQRIERLAGGLESQGVGVTPLEITSRRGDVIWLRSNFDKEDLQVPFAIWQDDERTIEIPEGRYSFADHGIEFRGAAHRKFSGRIAWIRGDFYTGDITRTFGNFVWQPSPRFRGRLGYTLNDVDLPEGSFQQRLASLGLDVVFSSTLSWVNLIQYDNVTETAGINLRLHWIPEAGREVFFVINHNMHDIDRDNRFESLTSDATAKMSYTFRF